MVQGDGSYWRNIGNESPEEYFKFSIEGYKEAISDRERDFLNFLEGLIQETRRRTKAKNPRKYRYSRRLVTLRVIRKSTLIRMLMPYLIIT